jgi:hypothetical protein
MTQIFCIPTFLYEIIIIIIIIIIIHYLRDIVFEFLPQ